MEGQNKHFSHSHNLNIYHIPEGTEITCSGCNSSGTASVYACWQCNFFLHEQCFHAARSLQHPSHPSHPLTLLPFPTYPSNSFYCNSCNQIGTGFTYCCSDCEFDLHVQCAYSISLSSLLTPQTHILPQQNQMPSFGTHLTNQAPIFNPQYGSVPHQEPTNQPIPSAPFLNYPIVNETGASFNGAHFSPILYPSHNPQPITSNHFQNYPPINETVQNFNNPESSHIPSHNPPVKETVQNFNHIQNYPQPSHNPQPIPNNPQNSHILSHDPPINEKEQNFDHIQNYPQPSHNPQPISKNNIPSYPSINEPLPSLNAPQISQIPQAVPIPTVPSKAETLPSLNAPMNAPQSSNILSQNPPIKETEQNFNHVQNNPQPSHNPQPIPNNNIPGYPSINETLPSLNAPMNSQIPLAASQPISPNVPIPTVPSKSETLPSLNAPMNAPQSSNILSQNPPIKETEQNFNHVQNNPQPSHNPQPIPKNNIPGYPSINETLPSLNAPMNSQIPLAASQPISPNVHIPTSPPKVETSTSSSATIGVSYTEPPSKTDQVDQVKAREIMHFSHPHALLLVNPKAGEDSTECSACEEIVTGSRYSCFKSGCDFHLDQSCFGLSQAILHKSHPEHPLTLLSYACDQYGQFICRACYDDGYGFTYHCTTCEFDLHTKCACLPETVKRDDHLHPLKLIYSCPNKGKEYTFSCDECGGIVQENWWTYYCEECDYGTHVDCVYREESQETTAVTESQNEKSESSTGNQDLDFQLEMQRLQLELEMARQTAQMMANMGQSISNLAG